MSWWLTKVQARLAVFQTETATIEKQELSTDEYGASAHTWVTVASSVTCRVYTAGDMNRGMQGLIGEQEAISDVVKISFASGTTLEADYRVTVGSRIYQVVRVEDDRTQSTDVIAVCRRVRV